MVDLPMSPGTRLALGVGTPQRAYCLHEPVWPLDDQVLPFDQWTLRGWMTEPVRRAHGPVPSTSVPNRYFALIAGVLGDRLPQALGRVWMYISKIFSI